jgi:hypothetical protein
LKKSQETITTQPDKKEDGLYLQGLIANAAGIGHQKIINYTDKKRNSLSKNEIAPHH